MKHNITTFIFLTLVVLSSVVFWETDYIWIVMSLLTLIYISVTAYGSANIQANYFLKSVNYGKRKSVALTFDDGPDPETTPKILKILREKDVPATFFLIGKKAEKYPELVRQIQDEGHILGNHSYSHHFMIGFYSPTRLKKDLGRCSDVISNITGKTPSFFRPPFGVTNPRYQGVLQSLSLTSVGWSLRTLDTRAKNKYQVIDKVLSKLKKGNIVLMHDHLAVTADALEDILEHISSKGIGIEPLDKLINREPYAKV